METEWNSFLMSLKQFPVDSLSVINLTEIFTRFHNLTINHFWLFAASTNSTLSIDLPQLNIFYLSHAHKHAIKLSILIAMM